MQGTIFRAARCNICSHCWLNFSRHRNNESTYYLFLFFMTAAINLILFSAIEDNSRPCKTGRKQIFPLVLTYVWLDVVCITRGEFPTLKGHTILVTKQMWNGRWITSRYFEATGMWALMLYTSLNETNWRYGSKNFLVSNYLGCFLGPDLEFIEVSSTALTSFDV